MEKKTRFLRCEEVLEKVGFCHATLYYKMERGLFPPQISIGPKMVAWLESEIEDWMRACMAGCSDDEIRALVRQRVAEREKPATRYRPFCDYQWEIAVKSYASLIAKNTPAIMQRKLAGRLRQGADGLGIDEPEWRSRDELRLPRLRAPQLMIQTLAKIRAETEALNSAG